MQRNTSVLDIYAYPDQSWSAMNLSGFDIVATDGEIGSIDEDTYRVGTDALLVNTGPWIFGKGVLIPAGVISRIDEKDHKVFVNLTKDQIKNAPEVDEYLRRQSMSFRDYDSLLDRLKRDFPGEPFLVVRYGDHQPEFASFILEPELDEDGINRRLMTYDPRYFTTYYAIDTVNFEPVNVTSALDTIEGPYLPLIVQEMAGLPLDASFAEQKRVLERCRGLFYACAGGKEARRFLGFRPSLVAEVDVGPCHAFVHFVVVELHGDDEGRKRSTTAARQARRA